MSLVALVVVIVLGLAYALLPIFPGPPAWMTDIFTNPNSTALEGGTRILLIQVFIVKIIVALSAVFVLLTAFSKKPLRQ